MTRLQVITLYSSSHPLLLILSIFLSATGMQVLLTGIQQLIEGVTKHSLDAWERGWLVVVMGIVIFSKLCLYLYCRTFKSDIVQAYATVNLLLPKNAIECLRILRVLYDYTHIQTKEPKVLFDAQNSKGRVWQRESHLSLISCLVQVTCDLPCKPYRASRVCKGKWPSMLSNFRVLARNFEV